MTRRSRSELENLFKTGAKPSGEDFRDFIESTFNFKDDDKDGILEKLKTGGGTGTTTTTTTTGGGSGGGGQQGPLTITNLQFGGSGPTINKISTDGDLSGNSDNAIPTEKAVKEYVDKKTKGFESYSQGRLSSRNGGHTLIMQENDGNLSSRNGGHTLIMQENDGNLVVYKGDPKNQNPLWSWKNGKVSDINLKQDIATLDNALSKLLSLRGVSFHWQDKEIGKNREIGVIAQEVEQVFPELVSTTEGNSKLVQYENFVPVLIEAIKEQQKTISQLQQEIEAIKGNRQ